MLPSSRGLGRRPLTAVTAVQIRSGVLFLAERRPKDAALPLFKGTAVTARDKSVQEC